MTKKKIDIELFEMLEDIDKASEGAALVENDHVNPVKIKRDRSPTKGNNKLLTSLPETLEADFYELKSSGLAKGSYSQYIIQCVIKQTDLNLKKKEKKEREQV
ncbi:conserved hypothetical protein [Vibrio crassostreae]|uniref:hypothetical protein n=1 Tax=Vibrio TaxID=662 RepID=UPI000C82136F|nr:MULTISPECIES: hypothetical protein [Vibrio]PMH79840.1 hypothetical protein BCU58_24635 [Vibrio sp. 10N.286.48.B7]TCT63787.1 hypothetical protein EDB40_101279 [Vibrio crassostreae]CAK2019407.1 conserved hypothetical protein [Vibrio crassostreae]CAK2070722.1 conserved hypothetical protein [Vibrio crassostreae]CAK2091547.1 conserved hypothetical protein [Vibrio crassostreae]